MFPIKLSSPYLLQVAEEFLRRLLLAEIVQERDHLVPRFRPAPNPRSPEVSLVLRCLERRMLSVRNRASFLNFSYVCPEPVLVKRPLLALNGAKKTFSDLNFSHCPSRSGRPDRMVFSRPLPGIVNG